MQTSDGANLDDRARPGGGDRERTDWVDAAAGIGSGNPLRAIRQRREKVLAATQASLEALLDPALPDLSLLERCAVAVLACNLTPAPTLAVRYRSALTEAGADAALEAAIGSGDLDRIDAPRLRAILTFARTLIERPVAGDRAALLALPRAGLTTPGVVALAQWVAFLSYQARVVTGLKAMGSPAAGEDAAAIDGSPSASGGSPADRSRPNTASATVAATASPPGGIIRAHGFTNEALEWSAWLDPVALESASAGQIAVLEESHPKAKVSDYYRLLVHQPRILRERSSAFNAIMYAPGGLSRAERELAATVVSRVNGCVYCASVHAQRFEQLARRQDVIAAVFEDPAGAGSDTRERAIVRFSVELTRAPDRVDGRAIASLRAAGLDDGQVLDLIHVIAVFAWANRLMLNLGEPIFPEETKP